MNWKGKKKGCRRYGELLSAYLDDELSPLELGEIGTHLKACPDCSRTLEELIELKGLMQVSELCWDRPIPAEGFRASVLAHLDAPLTAAPPRRAWEHVKRLARPGVMAAAAALLVIGITAGIFMGYRQARLASVPGAEKTGEVMLAGAPLDGTRVEDYILEHAMESSSNLLLGYDDAADFVNYVEYREP